MKRGGDTDMRFFDNFLKKIVRKKQVDSQEEEPQEYLSPQEAERTFEETPSSPASLELSHEHPLYRLYDMRTEKSRNTPPPEIVMKGCEELSETQIRKELMRFRIEMTKAADFRLKDATPKAADEEDETPHLEPSMDAQPFVYV